MQYKEYKVFHSRYLHKLEANVSANLKQGWICQGGIFLTSQGRDYAQAMVLPVQPEDAE